MENLDLIRSEIFNKKFGYKKYLWVMDFRFSEILEQEVALAGDAKSKEIVIIDVFGEPVKTNL
jgi:hypothetical protein